MPEFVELLERTCVCDGQPLRLMRYHHEDLWDCTGEVQYPQGWMYYADSSKGLRYSVTQEEIGHPINIPDKEVTDEQLET